MIGARSTLPLAAWPQADRVAWAAALADGDIFDGRGPCAHWSATTRGRAEWGYGRWLGWVARVRPEVLDRPPVARLTPERVRLYVETLQSQVSTMSVHIYADHLLLAARAIAPAADWSWLRATVRRLAAAATPRRRAVAEAQDLLDFGFRLMAQADFTSPQGRVDYRDGLLIALLILRPVRRKNLAAIELGRQLRHVGDVWTLVFEAAEMKGGEPYEAPWPDMLAPHLARYLAEVRPLFPRADRHAALWASIRGRPLCDQQIADMVSERTEATLGRRINLHAFRSIAASTLAVEAPEHAAAARDLLGHAHLHTTEQHYLRAMPRRASREQQKLIARLKAELAPVRRRAPRLKEIVR